MPVLEIHNASVRIPACELLHDISLRVHEQEILAIVGPNGAGKSSLLRAVAGDLSLSQGEILLAGRHLIDWDRRERARHLAVLPQLSLLNFPYTAQEVVALGRTPHSTGNEIDQIIIREAMLAMDVNHLHDRFYTELSGGEKQRVQLARVMAQIWRPEDADSRLLLLDEPAAALDLGHQQLLMEKIRQFARTGAAVVMVLHDLNMAARYSDSILAMACGRVLAQGKSREVITVDLVERLFSVKVKVLRDPDTQSLFVIP